MSNDNFWYRDGRLALLGLSARLPKAVRQPCNHRLQ